MNTFSRALCDFQDINLQQSLQRSQLRARLLPTAGFDLPGGQHEPTALMRERVLERHADLVEGRGPLRTRSFSQHAAPSVDRVTLQLRLHQVPTVGPPFSNSSPPRGPRWRPPDRLRSRRRPVRSAPLPSRFATPAIPEMSLLPSTRRLARFLKCPRCLGSRRNSSAADRRARTRATAIRR